MSLDDPTMGATFPSWTSDTERGAADKMPAWGVPGETPEEGEWPARDRVPRVTTQTIRGGSYTITCTEIGLRPAEVTPEMVRAGQLILPHLVEEDIVEVFQAMHAAAPVPLVSDAEIALTRERDEARAQGADALKIITKMADTQSMQHEIELTLRAELMVAHDQLAKFTAQDLVEPEAPDPIANAIRPREVDPRRMGLA